MPFYVSSEAFDADIYPAHYSTLEHERFCPLYERTL